MRSLLALLFGVTLAVVLFASGVAASSWLLQDPAPHQFAHLDERPLWTNEPVQVNLSEQSFERIAAAPVPAVYRAMAVDATAADRTLQVQSAALRAGDEGLDLALTASIDAAPMTDLAGSPHASWCAERYRSYRIEDNSYQPHGSARRPCHSPYLVQEAAYSSEFNQPLVEDESAHVAWCMDRYRSYQPSDNSYQPHNGPRRLCKSPFG